MVWVHLNCCAVVIGHLRRSVYSVAHWPKPQLASRSTSLVETITWSASIIRRWPVAIATCKCKVVLIHRRTSELASTVEKLQVAPRIVNVWNSLPEIVISADTTDTFKRRLDKFWQHQDILYDYKIELAGVGNRSVMNADETIVL